MILVQWSCKVPQQKREIFLNYAKTKLIPFYRSHGCLRYELFFPMITEKKYFSYQISDDINRYIEQLIFKDLKDFNTFYESIEKEESAQEIVGKYRSQFDITNCNFKILTQVE